MAKVQGPLLSLSASGEFGGLMEFRTGAAGTVAAAVKKVKPPRSPAQVSQSQRFANAVTGWAALTPEQKATWKATATPLGLTGYQYYVRQYQAQNIVPPGQPV